MQIFILNKTTRKNDGDDRWVFSTREKLDEFQKKFRLEDNEESTYESWTMVIDPLSL